MKQASAAAFILLAIGGVHAAKFALPECAVSCLSVPQTCEATEAFCSSACFGPCLTSGCSGAYDQQQLIKTCSKSFASGSSGASATVTATTTKKPQAAATASNDTETSTKTAKSDEAANAEKTPIVEKPKSEKSDDPLAASSNSSDSSNSTNSTTGNSTSTDPTADTGSAAHSFVGSMSAGLALFVLGLALL